MIDWSPLVISLKTASLTMIFVFFLGLLAAQWVVNLKSEGLKIVLDGLLTLPLVLTAYGSRLFSPLSFRRKAAGWSVFSGILRSKDPVFLSALPFWQPRSLLFR